MLVFPQIRASAFGLRGQLLSPSSDTSPTSKSTTEPEKAKSFADTGFSFIPIREAHLSLFRFLSDRDLPQIQDVLGRTMIDQHFLPRGAVFFWFEPEGIVSIHAHFGKWLKIFPKDILRAMHETANEGRRLGITDAYAYADKEIDGSDKLLEWLGGKPTGEETEFGPIYKLDMRRSKI